MPVQKNQKYKSQWRRKKKTKSHFPIHTVRPEVEIVPGDELIAEGKVENTSRLVQLARSKVPKLYPSLINNPLLDPDSRYAVVLGILSTPNHIISLRRKHDFLFTSSEIHYYREENRKKLLTFINTLSYELQTQLLKSAQNRINEVKAEKDLLYKDIRELRQSVNLIREMNAYKPSYIVEVFSHLFWEVAENLVIAEAQEINNISFKHINDVTHAKLTAVWKIRNIDELGISEFYDSKSHPVIISSLYLARIRMRHSLNAYGEMIRNLHDFSNNYLTYLQIAREKELEIQRQEAIRDARREEVRLEKIEMKRRLAAEKEEIERLRRETVFRFAPGVGLSGSGGGDSWGATNNSRYRKGG